MTTFYSWSGRRDDQINARMIFNSGDMMEGIVFGNIVHDPWPMVIMAPPKFLPSLHGPSFEFDHITENGWAVYFELTKPWKLIE